MNSRTACVIGWPIAHSRSPLIHRYWLDQLGIDGDYQPISIAPDQIATFLAEFKNSEFIGGNVTVPHKEAAFRAVDDADAVAVALAAVNTLWLDGGKLRGGNTDVDGFLANLDDNVPGWSGGGGVAVVLGAGGTARAIVWALLQRQFESVTVVNRTLDRAEGLVRDFGDRVRAAGWRELADWLPKAAILINATSLGMVGQPPLDLDLTPLQADTIVQDIVYVPLETAFLQRARDRGLAAFDGLGMLLHQAAPGFEKWFGVRPTVTTDLRDLVVADLAGS